MRPVFNMISDAPHTGRLKLSESAGGNSLSGPRGFTIIELLLVIVIVSLTLGLVSVRLGAVDFWREQSSIRKLQETIALLNTQAILDQQFYRMEFDLKGNSFRAGVMRPDDAGLASSSMASSTGINLDILEEQLALLLSPESSSGATMIPPPNMPALAEPNKLGGRYVLLDVVTSEGKVSRDDEDAPNPAIRFSPRGVSDFGVIHISTGGDSAITIVANPWTGLAEIHPGYKDFKWTMHRQDRD
ncbi:MAG: type II secretion system protein [Pseudomonadota bacterium]